jgi:hypothetical protein
MPLSSCTPENPPLALAHAQNDDHARGQNNKRRPRFLSLLPKAQKDRYVLNDGALLARLLNRIPERLRQMHRELRDSKKNDEPEGPALI